ncbi:inovirus Gp2 family protein [Variovorax guangxiensis]|nr:inovirus Gp2 family protein [Variovorax guangxiensis]
MILQPDNFYDEDYLDTQGRVALRMRDARFRKGVLTTSSVCDKPISFMHRYAKKFASSTEALVHLRGLKNGTMRFKLTAEGERFLRALLVDHALVFHEFPMHDFSPVYRLFLRIGRLLPAYVRLNLEQSYDVETAERICCLVERFAQAVQTRLRRKRFKDARINFRRGAAENHKNFSHGLNWLSERHDEVVALRFDLFSRDPSIPTAGWNEVPDPDQLMPFKADCEAFHRAIDRHYGNALLGYAWALEYGRDTRFHKHYLVLLDPRRFKDDLAEVAYLRLKWEAIAKHGWMYSSNESTDDHAHRAFGLIRLSDPEVVSGLRFIVSYFTLAALFVKLSHRDKPRTFYPGKFPKGPAPTVGRPRQTPRGAHLRVPVDEAVCRYQNFI